MKTPAQFRQEAREIWQAGVDAVRSERLVLQSVRRNGATLTICEREFSLPQLNRIAVVGAGKAGAGMAAGVEQALGPDILRDKVLGWVNVPADCVRALRKIHLHPARPPGYNEPTEEGVAGALRILEIVASLGPDDLCLVLLSGGGSALLPAPVAEITLADKLALTRFLMNAGATIVELNSVRKRLSRIKGGQLARAIRAGAVQTLIISDVVGDPLDVIASGPTVPDATTAADALAILRKYHAQPPSVSQSVLDYLSRTVTQDPPSAALAVNLENHVIGNNAVALAAASAKAEALGYAVQSLGSANQGEANEVGQQLAELCRGQHSVRPTSAAPLCILSGGEPVVHLATTDRPRKGGRNQQLVLAALDCLWDSGMDGIVVLSGGTDGEDGPTDAAGAIADAELWQAAHAAPCPPRPFLERNDAYTYFQKFDALLKTGPTHTNVMDLRVALVVRPG